MKRYIKATTISEVSTYLMDCFNDLINANYKIFLKDGFPHKSASVSKIKDYFEDCVLSENHLLSIGKPTHLHNIGNNNTYPIYLHLENDFEFKKNHWLF